MKVFINIIGVEIVFRRQVTLEPASPAVKDVIGGLRDQCSGELRRFVGDDLKPIDGSVILVNGRNILSLENGKTQIHDGDEITFMVPVAGG